MFKKQHLSVKLLCLFVICFACLCIFLSYDRVYADTMDSGHDLYDLDKFEDNRESGLSGSYRLYKKTNYKHDPDVLKRVYNNKTLEQHLVDSINNLVSDIDVSGYQLDKSEDAYPFYDVMESYPELFFVDELPYYHYNQDTNIITSYHVEYIGSKSEIDAQKHALESSIDEIVSQVPADLTDTEKALVVHDLIAISCRYSDADGVKNGVSIYDNIKHTAYSCLVNHDAVCDGYSDAYAYIMKSRFHINCETIISTPMLHAWNMIELDGYWYHVDLTWDDLKYNGLVTHKYFLCSDDVFQDDEHNHNDWVSDYKADSDLYENAFWRKIISPIQYYHGQWVYSRIDRNSMKVKLVKCSTLDLDGKHLSPEFVLYKAKAWSNGWYYWADSYMSVQKYHNFLYFNTKDGIYKLGTDEKPVLVASPKMRKHYSMFGFSIHDNAFLCDLFTSPDKSDSRELVTAVCPTLQDLNYRLYDYKVPDGVFAYSNSYLSEIRLPDRFVWQDYRNQKPDAAKLVREGVFVCYVTYLPEDSMSYDVIHDIPVRVQVSCQGHKYIKKDYNKKRVETCLLCKDKRVTYKLSGIKCVKREKDFLIISWNKVPDVDRYKAVLYVGHKKIAAKTVKNTKVKFDELKPGKKYKIKIYDVRKKAIPGSIKVSTKK